MRPNCNKGYGAIPVYKTDAFGVHSILILQLPQSTSSIKNTLIQDVSLNLFHRTLKQELDNSSAQSCNKLTHNTLPPPTPQIQTSSRTKGLFRTSTKTYKKSGTKVQNELCFALLRDRNSYVPLPRDNNTY